MRRSVVLLPALAVAAVLGAAGSAHAEFLATTSDPAGDSADPAAGRDITAFGMTYDRTSGHVFGSIRFRGSPADTPGYLVLALGQRSATGCNGYPAVTLSGLTDSILATWRRFDSPTIVGATDDADKSGLDEQVQTFEVEDKALAGRRFTCAIGSVNSQDDFTVPYDGVSAPLVGQPSLDVRTKAPKMFARNRTTTIRFLVSNPGDASARGVKLRLGKARGLSIDRPSRALRTLAPGKHKLVKVKVRFSNRASTSTSLAVKATSGKLVARGKIELAVKPLPSRKPKGGSGGKRGSRTPMLCNRFQPDLTGQTGGSLVLVYC